MKRLLLLSIMAAIAISAMALIGFRSNGGPDVASAHVGTGIVHIEIDMVKDGSSPDVWCNPVDNAATHATGSNYEVAICLSDASTSPSQSPSAFNIQFLYDDTLNTCTDANPGGTALDDNPDANTGTTVFSGSTGVGNLGTNWDCSGGGLNPPVCDKDTATGPLHGQAFISCNSTSAPTLPVGPGVSHPIAVVSLHAAVAGIDNLDFGVVAIYRSGGTNVLRCPEVVTGTCWGATDTKQAPPPTSTPTPLAAQCDIGVSPIVASVLGTPVAALNMKVGDPPKVVDLSATFTNNGNVDVGAPDAMCSMAIVFAAELAGSPIPTGDVPIPAASLGVRVEPYGSSTPPYGDVCLACNPLKHPPSSGLTASQCVQLGLGMGSYYPTPDPYLPPYWDYVAVPCDEGPFSSAAPVSFVNHSCEDGIDNQPPYPASQLGTCDWGGFSKLCAPPTTPDVNCLDVPLIGLVPLYRTVLSYPGQTEPTPVPPNTSTKVRQAKIECRERGVYPVVLIAGAGNTSTAVEAPYVGPSHDPNAANDSSFTVVTVTCTKGPEMVKDCDPDTEGIQTNCNLWLIDPNFPGKDTPEVLPAADDNGCVIAAEGKGCLAVDVWLKSADDEDDLNDGDTLKECLGAWEHQIRFDHKLIKFVNDLNPDTLWWGGDVWTSWLESTGRIANCTISVLSEDWILEGCVTKDDPDNPGMQVGPCGDGIIEQMLIIPQYNDLIYRSVFRPTKDNGVVTNIVDDNCEITDIYGEPMADTLPGQLTPICGDLHITIRMLEGDIDLDCDVDVVDDQALAFRYGAHWGLQLYDQWFDLEPKFADQDIDIKDLQFVFGRNYSTCQLPIPDDQAIPVDPGQP